MWCTYALFAHSRMYSDMHDNNQLSALEPAAFSKLTALTQLYGRVRCIHPTQTSCNTGHTGAHVVQALICRFPSARSTTLRCAPCMSTASVLTHTRSYTLLLPLCSCLLFLYGNSTVGMDVFRCCNISMPDFLLSMQMWPGCQSRSRHLLQHLPRYHPSMHNPFLAS
jgi:hypothetical protein